MSNDRRIHDRTPCMIGAVLRGPNGQERPVALSDVSEGGAFLPTGAPMRPGSRVEIAFPHPETGRPVQVGARVARRVLNATGEDAIGNGLYFERSLSALQDERRGAPRERCQINSKVRTGDQTVNGALEDISDTGALLSTHMVLAIGSHLRVIFRHPTNGTPIVTWAEVARGPLELPSGGRGYGLRFDVTQDDLGDAVAHAIEQRPRGVALKGGHDLTALTDAELAEHDVGRWVRMHEGEAICGAELLAASKTELFVASRHVPGAGSTVSIAVPSASNPQAEPIVVCGVVTQVGGPAQPGFLLSVRRFARHEDKTAWASFIRGLTTRSYGRPLH